LDIFHEWITLDFHDKLSYGNPRVSRGGQVDYDRTGKISSRKKDLRKMGISWDEVEEDRRSLRNLVAQCVFDAG